MNGIVRSFMSLKDPQTLVKKRVFNGWAGEAVGMLSLAHRIKRGYDAIHNRVIVLSTTITSQLQGLASAYRLDVMSKDLVEGKTVIRESIQESC